MRNYIDGLCEILMVSVLMVSVKYAYVSSSRSISSSGRRCPDVTAKLMPVLRHSACRCHRTERICDVFLPSLSWLSSASFLCVINIMLHIIIIIIIIILFYKA